MGRGHWLACCVAGLVACQPVSPVDFSLPKLTSDRMVGFVRLYVDPSELDGYWERPGPSRGRLVLENPFAAWVDVYADEVPLGRLAPRGRAQIQGMTAGQWAIRYQPGDAPGVIHRVTVTP